MSIPADTTAPPRLPDYDLLKLIGSGSYGDVWLARGVTGAFRAVKIVWRDRFTSTRPYAREFEGVTRFASISLREPSQLALLHTGRSDDAGFFYYVMELADDADQGRAIEPQRYVPLTLKELRRRCGRLPPQNVVGLGVALARALASLHAAGLVHRDIKPSNVVLIGGVPKLADVGLVAAASADLTFVGTEGFVPPEGPGAPAADVYSLGKVLYELSTGMDRHDWPRLPAEFANIPERRELLELNEVLVRACESNPAKRFVDATAFLDELLLLQAGKSVRRLRAAERRMSRALRMAALLGVAAALAGAGAWIEHRRAANETAQRLQAESERAALAHRTIYAAQLAQAQRALEQEDLGRARRLLAGTTPRANEPDLRHIEWRALDHLARGNHCDILREKGPEIDVLAVSPDGSILAAHDDLKRLILFDTSTLREIRIINGVHRFGGFSSDGEWVVGTTPQQALQRWRVTDGAAPGAPHSEAIYRPLGAQGRERVIAVSYPAAADAIAGKPDRPLQLVVWDFAEQREIHRLPLGEAADPLRWEYFRHATTPGGEHVLIACRRNDESPGFRFTRVSFLPHPQLVHDPLTDFLPNTLGFTLASSEPSWWATEAQTGRRLIYETHQEKWQSALSLPNRLSVEMMFSSRAGPLLLRAHQAHVVVLPQHATTELGRLRGHSAMITDMVAVRATNRIFTSSAAGELRAWLVESIPGLQHRNRFWASPRNPGKVFYSQDGRSLYVPDDGRAVAIVDVATQRVTNHIAGMRHVIGTTASEVWGISADGLALVAATSETGQVRPEFARHISPIVGGAISANKQRLVFLRTSGELGLVDLASERQLSVPLERGVYRWSLTLDATGDRLWMLSNDRRLESCGLPTGVRHWNVSLPAMPTHLCWLPRDDLLVVSLENGDLQFHDARTGALRRTTPSGSAAVQSLVVTHDGARLIAGGIEGDLHVHDVTVGGYLASIPMHSAEPINHVALAPDDSSFAVFRKTGLLHIVQTGADR